MNKLIGAVVGVVVLLSGLLSPVAAHEQSPALAPPALSTSSSAARSTSVQPVARQSEAQAAVGAEQMQVAPRPGEGFSFRGQWLAPGVVGLDWDDVAGASGYELLVLGTDGWILLATDEPVDGVVAVREGSAARVGGLPADVDEYWFALRARSTAGVSRWSSGLEVQVPEDASERLQFDPFTAPTLSNIDLERLGEATATVTPGEADCGAVSALDVAGISVVDPCGDDDEGADGQKGWQANRCSGHNFDHAPAVYSLTGEVVTVSAVNYDGRRPDFSTFKDFVDLAAPGGRLLSTVPVVTCDPEDTNGDGVDDRWGPLECGLPSSPIPCAPTVARRTDPRTMPPGGCAHPVFEKSGTSQAAPFVSGVVAHMVNRHPDATVGQIRAALENTTLAPPAAEVPTARGRDGDDELIERLSAGLRRIRQPGRPGFHTENGLHAPSMEYGRGIVNPAAAVARLGDDLRIGLSPQGDAGLFMELSAGARHTCGLRSNGAVQCWGERAIRDATPSWAFASLSSPPTARFVCGVRSGDGAAQCWGELPAAITSPVAVSAGTGALRGRFIEVAAGDRHVCGLRPDGGVVCWGDNSDGQTEVPTGTFDEPPSIKATKVVAGSEHSCMLLSTGAVECWGKSDDERLLAPSALVVSDVAAGAAHTCAVTAADVLMANLVSCWGVTPLGRAAGPAGRFTEVDAGADHSCGLLAYESDELPGGRVRCWGYGGPDEVPDQRLDAPAGVFSHVSAGAKHGCALTVVKDVHCWGDDEHGQAPSSFVGRLGALSLTAGGVDLLAGRFDPAVYEYTVVAEPGPATLRAATDTTDGSHSLLESLDGSGGGSLLVAQSLPKTLVRGAEFEVVVGAAFGQVGHRTYRIRVLERAELDSLRVVPSGTGPDCVPQCAALELIPPFDPKVTRYRVVAAADVSDVSVEYRSTDGVVALTPADSDSSAGGHQVALGTETGFVSVSAGSHFSCGVKTGGSVECWGYSQLAAPSGSFASVSAGSGYVCGVKSDSSVECWGHDADGQASPPPGSFRSVDAGSNHTCGVKTDDTLACWGDNRDGKASPPSGSFASVSAGSSHSCGLRSSGSLACWGNNFRGKASPPSGSFVSVSAGSSHSCGVRISGAAVCWGWNVAGEASPPSGSFSSVSAGSWWHSCGTKTDGTAVCWGALIDNRFVPVGKIASLSAGHAHACGVTADGVAACWGDEVFGAHVAPSGSFSSVVAGPSHSCGVQSDGSVACWGLDWYGMSSPPSGSFSSVALGYFHSCGLRLPFLRPASWRIDCVLGRPRARPEGDTARFVHCGGCR
ncbi:S8 family serine peptidase [Candidatus Poriferisodalis sp.]|uniref:S8 family serine peptidase n=1 Tax=Candidatus Poriferisodalis sp. TaxID=3101277 RepID=UPI003B01304A